MHTSYIKGHALLSSAINSVMWVNLFFFEDDAGKLGKSDFRFGTTNSAIGRSGFSPSHHRKKIFYVYMVKFSCTRY